MVPRAGIEPATQSSSGFCSTTELPRHRLVNVRKKYPKNGEMSTSCEIFPAGLEHSALLCCLSRKLSPLKKDPMKHSLKERILELQSLFSTATSRVNTPEELEAVRLQFLSRNGLIAQLTDELKALPVEEKRLHGQLLNELKVQTQQQFEAKQQQLAQAELEKAALRKASFDVTAYQPGQLQGSVHPYTQVIEQIEDLFVSMGFTIADGNEVESDFYNFTALNIPEDHPARDMHDTFWLRTPGWLLRTHTSSTQIHTMQKQQPPIAMMVNGRVYRHEATDATHDFMFMQTEGMLIDKNISLAHLISSAEHILKRIFEKNDLKFRLRPAYYPFVEPGLDIDISCPFCKGGCSICKYTGWIEAAGSGMIHPNVLRAGGIDPKKYSGWAFGFGLTRLVMFKFGINDIRLLHGSSLDFLKQF
jgi:phenylalanyl-tRNA synthetase alpha chain